MSKLTSNEEKHFRVSMTNPLTGKREVYRTRGTREVIEQVCDEIWKAAGYTDIQIKEL